MEMNRDTRRGIRTWLNVGTVAASLLFTGWLIYLLRNNANGLVWIASLLLGNSLIFTMSHAIENGLQRLAVRWGDKSIESEGERD